jgi:hypothetical protein
LFLGFVSACAHGWKFTGCGDGVLIAGELSVQTTATVPGVPPIPRCGPPERSNTDEGALRVIPIIVISSRVIEWTKNCTVHGHAQCFGQAQTPGTGFLNF